MERVPYKDVFGDKTTIEVAKEARVVIATAKSWEQVGVPKKYVRAHNGHMNGAAVLYANPKNYRQDIYGCSFTEAVALNGTDKLNAKACLAFQYRHGRINYTAQGVGWELTFPQWVKLWKDSGKIDQRGAGQYGMFRKDHSKPFSVDNVVIQTLTETRKQRIAEGLIDPGKRKKKRKAKRKTDVAKLTRHSGLKIEIFDPEDRHIPDFLKAKKSLWARFKKWLIKKLGG